MGTKTRWAVDSHTSAHGLGGTAKVGVTEALGGTFLDPATGPMTFGRTPLPLDGLEQFRPIGPRIANRFGYRMSTIPLPDYVRGLSPIMPRAARSARLGAR